MLFDFFSGFFFDFSKSNPMKNSNFLLGFYPLKAPFLFGVKSSVFELGF